MPKFTKQIAYVDGVRAPEFDKISSTQWFALYELSRSMRASTRAALVRQGLIKNGAITPKGTRALRVEWRDAS